jgi:hypothetical protein
MADTQKIIPPAFAIAKKVNGQWELMVKCPYCGQQHTHGGGNGEKPDGGHRNAHCVKKTKDNLGYTISILGVCAA